MRRLTWDRSLLVASYLLFAIGCVGWWAASGAVADPSPVSTLLAVWLAAGVLVVVTRWHAQCPDIAPLPSAMGLATATPLAMVSVVSIGSGIAVGIGIVLATLAIAPLAWEMTRRLPRGSARRTTRVIVGVCLVGAPSVALAISFGEPMWSGSVVGPTELWWALVTMAVLAATAAAALATIGDPAARGGSNITAALGYLGMGVTVSAASFALAVSWWPTLVIPAFAVASTVAFLGRFAIGPLEAEASTARSERDLVVSALEAERSRVASTIHDGPLGDLALLVQQLDASGDARNADLARSISSDLRVLGNELRVPILEDLGAGPAIEWLADRVSERSHMPIETELQGNGGRPPTDVELAVFRVAQEAILNAVKHGRGPIRVRYDAAPSAASLSVTDEGPGITDAARHQATQDGHLGLTLMTQRADAIGARLRFSSRRTGGTRVELEWGTA